jgi:hypothetical protein
MGNINYQNLMCENYYCQSVSFKPEWFSETSWAIDYKINNKISDDLEISYIKPYIINKGIIIIKNTPKFDLIFSKKLLLDFNEKVNFSIPINFKCCLKNPLNIYIIFSETNLDLKNVNQSLFYKHLKIFKKNIFIKNENHENNIAIPFRAFSDTDPTRNSEGYKFSISKKIKYNKYHKFEMILESDNNSIIIDESLYYKEKKYYNEKYVKILEFNENLHSGGIIRSFVAPDFGRSASEQALLGAAEKNLYLSIFIRSEHNIENNKEYIELSFD